MTRDEIKLVVFIVGALLIGAVVQNVRKHPQNPPPVPASPAPTPHGWAKPPYVLKESKTRGTPATSDER